METKQIGLLVMFLFTSSLGYCSICANGVWEVRITTTSQWSSGYFNSTGTGTDFSQQDSTQIWITDLSIAGDDTSVVYSTAITPAASWVGNGLLTSSGTYEIVSINGNRIQLDRSAGVVNEKQLAGIGGAGRLTDAFLEQSVAGNIIYIGSGTYGQTGIISLATVGTVDIPIKIIGYATNRSSVPTGTSCPVINSESQATYSFILGNYTSIYNITILSAFNNGGALALGTYAIASNCKLSNITTTANKQAIGFNGSYNKVLNCEIICPNGNGVSIGNVNGMSIENCFIHKCRIGINIAGSAQFIYDNIISSYQIGINCSASDKGGHSIKNNSLFGNFSSTGIYTGDNFSMAVYNNIISSNNYGVVSSVAFKTNYFDYNDYWNNVTTFSVVTSGNISDLQGAHDQYLNPQFTNTATDDYSIGTNLKAKGFPGTFPGSNTIGYMDIGAVQREEQGTGTGGASIKKKVWAGVE